jgi:integrase
MKITLQDVVEDNVQPPATVAELAFLYKTTVWYSHLKPSTKKYYDYYILLLVKSPYGQKKPTEITPKSAEMIYRSLSNDHGHNVANLFSAVWCRIYQNGIKKEWLTTNPWATIEKKRSVARTTVWTEALVTKLVNAALEQGLTDVAIGFMLMYDTAQRPSDVLAMTHSMLKSDEDGPYLELFQSKTGSYVRVAITILTARLIGDGKDWEYLVGSKMQLGDFRKRFKKLANSLGINKQLQLRDLRRTALTEAGDGGATDDELMAQSGHKDRSMLDRYSVKTRSKALAASRARYANRYERFQ